MASDTSADGMPCFMGLHVFDLYNVQYSWSVIIMISKTMNNRILEKSKILQNTNLKSVLAV